jgi:uncharacterized membrane protein
VDGLLVWINLMFLMFVALLPFSAGLMEHLYVHPVSQFFYFGNLLAIAVLLNVHWQYAKWRDMIVDNQQTDADRLSFRLAAHSWIPLPAFLVVGWVLERLRK